MTGDYVVYVHRNKTNGKRYIGITNNPAKRWSGEGNRYKGCPHFYAAIQKYGWDGFTHEILESGLTLDEANEREKFYIAKYNTQTDGYNITEGGANPRPLGWHHSEEAKSKISEKMRGRKQSKEQRRKRSEWMQGRYVGCKNHKSTAVRCIDTGEVFDTQRSAAKAKGVSQSRISMCCQGKRNHVHGLRWEYVDTSEA